MNNEYFGYALLTAALLCFTIGCFGVYLLLREHFNRRKMVDDLFNARLPEAHDELETAFQEE